MSLKKDGSSKGENIVLAVRLDFYANSIAFRRGGPDRAIRLKLIDEDGSLLATVSGEIALTISIEIQPADATAAATWGLPDRGMHSATFSLDIARQSDVHR